MIKKCVIISSSCKANKNDADASNNYDNIKILGLTPIERMIFSAEENGIDEFLVLAGTDAPSTIIKGKKTDLKVRQIVIDGTSPDTDLNAIRDFTGKDCFLLILGGRIIDRRIYKDLLEEAAMPGKHILTTATEKAGKNSEYDDIGAYVLCPKIFDHITSLTYEEPLPTEPRKEMADKELVKIHRVEKNLWQLLKDKIDVKAAEKKLLKSLIKEADGFLSRNFTRPISLSMTRHFAKYRITPNQITYLNLVVGIISALLVSSATYTVNLIGLLLFEFTVILDGCDGEVARLKFSSSKTGAKIDTVIDFFTRVLFFTAIAIVNLKLNRTGFDYFMGISAPSLSALNMIITTVLLLKYNIPDEGCFSKENLDFRKNAGLFKKFIGALMKPEGFTSLFFILGVFRLYRLMLVLAALGYIGFSIFNIIIAVKTFRLRKTS